MIRIMDTQTTMTNYQLDVIVAKSDSETGGAIVASFYGDNLLKLRERTLEFIRNISDYMISLVPDMPLLKQVYIKEFIESAKVF